MYKQKSLLFFVSLVALTGLVESTCNSTNVFTADAKEKVKIKYKESTRRGVDYSKIEVEWSPFSMVENPDCIAKDELRLEFNNDGIDNNWKKTSEVVTPLARHEKLRWTIDADPCKEYYFKLWVGGDGGPASLTLDKPLKAISFQKLIDVEFEPPKPIAVQDQASSNDVEITWSEVCAQEIEIIYWPTRTEEKNFRKRGSAAGGKSVLMEGIESCSEYNYEVYAVIGEKVSEPLEDSFVTAPQEDSTFSVDPQVTPGLNSVSVMWNAWDQLPCVEEYHLTICEDEGECQPPKILEVGNIPGINQAINSLKECTSYNLSIQPIYPDLKMKAFDKLITTTSDDGVELQPKLEGNGEHQKTIYWPPINCAEEYIVYQKTGNGAWEVLEQTKNTSVQFNEDPCTKHFYGVAVNGKQDSMVEVLPLTSDKPVPVPGKSFTAESVAAGTVSFSWDSVQCAEEYVIYRDGEVVNRTKDTSAELQELACNKYRYSLKVEVDGKEYEMGEKEVFVQMDTSSAYQVDNLNVNYNNGNTSATLSWDVPTCITGYEIKVLSEDGEVFEEFNVSALKNEVSVTVNDLDMCNSSAPFQITAIPLVSSEMAETVILDEIVITTLASNCSSTVDNSALIDDNLYVVPILIAVFVFVGVLIVLLVFVIRKRRNSRIYDTENGKILPMYPYLNRSAEELEMDKIKY